MKTPSKTVHLVSEVGTFRALGSQLAQETLKCLSFTADG